MNEDGTQHPRIGEDFKTRLRWALDDGKYPPHVPPQPNEEDTIIIRRRVGHLHERTDQTPEKNHPPQVGLNTGHSGATRALSMGEV